MKRGLQLSCFLVATGVAPYAFGQGQTAAPLELGKEHAPTSAAPTTAPPEVGAPPAATTVPEVPNSPVTSPLPAGPAPVIAQPLTPLSLDPAAPELSSLPGGIAPAFGVASTRPSDWRFDFHGLLFVPLRVGFNTRAAPTADQAKTVLHAPAVVPGDFATFGYTNVDPDPWAQVNFSYGNRDVTATIIIAARSITEGNSFFNPPDQLGINDAFLTFRVANTDRIKIKLDVGAFANRYGNMGEYDSGRYGTPVIARIGGVGVTETGTFNFGKLTLLTELGLMGQLNKAPLGVEPAGWNGYLDANAGTSFVPHLHLGASYRDWAQLGVHVMRAFSADDRATPTNQPDGYIDVYAADARLMLKRYGHVYLALSETQAHHARSVSDVIQVLNAPGGYGLMNSYFGLNSGGGGDLTTFAMQYDLSIGNILRFPQHFEGMGPDVVASLFGIYTAVDTADPNPIYAGTTNLKYASDKLKYGAEVSYTPLSWLAVSGRYDRVIPNVADGTQTTSIVTPRVIFRSNYNARDQIVLQYSHYFNGSNVYATTGTPPPGGIVPNLDLAVHPDEDVLSLMASMWW